jgi:hypothetical protein
MRTAPMAPGLEASDLYAPADVAAAAAAWGATCGPAALAAILQLPVVWLRPLLGDYPVREYMHPTHMRQALTKAQVAQRVMRSSRAIEYAYGLLFLQFTGPWCQAGVPVDAASRHTHWVGTAWTTEYGTMIYDSTAEGREGQQGGWVTKREWLTRILPALTATIRRAYGGYYVRWACQVTLPFLPISRDTLET